MLDIPHNRSNAVVGGDFAVTRHLSGRGILSWQRTHGGLRFPVDVEPFPERYSEFHRLLQDNYLQVGGGASYSWHQWRCVGFIPPGRARPRAFRFEATRPAKVVAVAHPASDAD